ncbi:hypothetical protein [Geoalkalibacter sp.]|nr:hypothetical protein [Geoalkalibacter sp.]
MEPSRRMRVVIGRRVFESVEDAQAFLELPGSADSSDDGPAGPEDRGE